MVNGYAQYKAQSVNTMTQGELLILLYDEVSKRLLRAEMAIETQDWDVFEASVTRAKDIITHLVRGLDMQYEISASLYRMYDFFLFKLSKISAGRKKEDIEELKPLVKELRDTFKEADRLAATK